MRTAGATLTHVALVLLGCAPASCVWEEAASGTLVTRVDITAPDSAVLVGRALQLSAAAFDAQGNPVSNATFVWASEDSARLFVTGTGVAVPPAGSVSGDVRVFVTATPGTARDTVIIRVARFGDVKWRLPLGPMPLYGGPAQAPNGTVYVIGATSLNNYDATLYAVSPRGERLWERRLTQVNCCNFPVVGEDNAVYVVGQHVWAFTGDGTLKWSITTRPVDPLPNIPDSHAGALSRDGRLFAAMGYDLFALDAPTGDTLWVGPRALDAGWLLPPAISADGRTVYIKNTADSLYAFDAGTGSVRWAADDPLTSLSYGVGPALAGPRIIVPLADRLQELDTTGALVTIGADLGLGVSEPAIGADGTLYFQRMNRPGTRAHNPLGTTRWTLAPRARWTWYGGPALAAGGMLYVAATDGLYALQIADTGATVVWRYPRDTTASLVFVGAPLIGADGTVYSFTSCDYGREVRPCSDELIAFWEERPPDPTSPWPMWRHDARRSGQAHR